ncbi:MAG: hypothetical protein Q7R68_03640 [Nitrospirales bacterium]|nr:hypothetical protein [Nitrospirales bacterium]
MDLFSKVPLVEIPVMITREEKAWLEMMMKKGKIAVPPGGSLPEGSVISIFMRTMLWNSEEMRQSLDTVPQEALNALLEKKELIEICIQISSDQKAWLDTVSDSSKILLSPNDSTVSLFIRVLLENAIEQQRALERADPWADDDEE